MSPSKFLPKNVDEIIDVLKTNRETLNHCLKFSEKYYTKEFQPKKDGGVREFDKPNKILKKIQRIIYAAFLKHRSLSPYYHGYVKKRSSITNAKVHVGQKIILKTDISDFFPTINKKMVLSVFYRIGFNTELAGILTQLTTFDDYLPQGAPTSPALANIVLRPVVRKIEKWCRRNHLRLSVYADDITISGRDITAKHKSRLRKIVAGFGFSIKEGKTNIFDARKERVKITGVIVSKKLSIGKDEMRKLRAVVHNCVAKGPSTQTGEDVQKFKNHLTGKITRLKQVEGMNSYMSKTVRRIIAEFNSIDWSK